MLIYNVLCECNEYIDNYIRQNSELSFDKNGIIGCTGTLEKSLLQSIFDFGREYSALKIRLFSY